MTNLQMSISQKSYTVHFRHQIKQQLFQFRDRCRLFFAVFQLLTHRLQIVQTIQIGNRFEILKSRLHQCLVQHSSFLHTLPRIQSHTEVVLQCSHVFEPVNLIGKQSNIRRSNNIVGLHQQLLSAQQISHTSAQFNHHRLKRKQRIAFRSNVHISTSTQRSLDANALCLNGHMSSISAGQHLTLHYLQLTQQQQSTSRHSVQQSCFDVAALTVQQSRIVVSLQASCQTA